MLGILLFEPLYQERVWGGRTLESALGRALPAERKIGESWEIVDRVGAQSVVRSGPLAGKSLADLLAELGPELMGPRWKPGSPFPLIVKWLDCTERLSLQVHPTPQAAAALGGESKSENWYIAHTSSDAQIMVGHKAGTTREQFEQAIAESRAEDLVLRHRVAVGDSILVRAGHVHAIDAGNLILEIQQNSDTTYRIHDWGRGGLDGKPRKLHVAESLQSIQWDESPDPLVRAAPTSGTIADCDAFTIRRTVLGPGDRISIQAGQQPRILSVVSGSISCERGTLLRGENALVPYSGDFTFEAPVAAIVLLTENFV